MGQSLSHALRLDVVLSEATWEQVASLVLQRPWDGRCERCGAEEPTDPHHRWLRGQGGLDVPSNLAALGRRCHDWAHRHPADAADHGWIVQAPYDFRAAEVTLASGMTVRFTDDYGYDITGWP